jgi:hypothetical protein
VSGVCANQFLYYVNYPRNEEEFKDTSFAGEYLNKTSSWSDYNIIFEIETI